MTLTKRLPTILTDGNTHSLPLLCLLVLLVLVSHAQAESAPASKATAPKLVPAPDYFAQQQSDIKHYLTEVSEVLVGTQSYALLERKSNTPINKGVVLLLPDWHDFISPSQHIAYLEKSFPDLGYSTISIQPPAKPENYPSIALDEEAQTTQNKALIDDYLRQLQALMTSVMEKAQAQQGAILIVSAGSNAGYLTRMFAEQKIPEQQALIMLSAHLLTDENNKLFAQQLSENEIPTLDMYLKHDNQLVAPNIALRKQESKRNLKVEFRQHKINNFETGFYPENAMLGAITGWLTSMGW